MELRNVIGFLRERTRSSSYRRDFNTQDHIFKLILKDGRFLELRVEERFLHEMRSYDLRNLIGLGDPLSQFIFLVSYFWGQPEFTEITDLLQEEAYKTERLLGVRPDIQIYTVEEADKWSQNKNSVP